MRRDRNAWKGLRGMQRGRLGMRWPVRTRAIRNLDGKLCTGHDDTLQRWHQHFHGVLNVRSSYDVGVVNAVSDEYPVRSELADAPTEEEVMEAMGKLKLGEDGGKSGILPEMVRGCGGELMDYILDMFHTVWMEQRVPQEWRDALLVPIPKKGDLTQCNNWHGISLLEVVGEFFTKVVQVRLQRVAEEVLPDSQCGFQAGRECADMVLFTTSLWRRPGSIIPHSTSCLLTSIRRMIRFQGRLCGKC